uniref:Uncharacterized protein n=1 Tax=Arundo donax TaxID=35708 RepID=A0A0A9BYD2_ARUDO
MEDGRASHGAATSPPPAMCHPPAHSLPPSLELDPRRRLASPTCQSLAWIHGGGRAKRERGCP